MVYLTLKVFLSLGTFDTDRHLNILTPKRKSFLSVYEPSLLDISELLATACGQCTYFKAESKKLWLV